MSSKGWWKSNAVDFRRWLCLTCTFIHSYSSLCSFLNPQGPTSYILVMIKFGFDNRFSLKVSTHLTGNMSKRSGWTILLVYSIYITNFMYQFMEYLDQLWTQTWYFNWIMLIDIVLTLHFLLQLHVVEVGEVVVAGAGVLQGQWDANHVSFQYFFHILMKNYNILSFP